MLVDFIPGGDFAKTRFVILGGGHGLLVFAGKGLLDSLFKGVGVSFLIGFIDVNADGLFSDAEELLQESSGG